MRTDFYSAIKAASESEALRGDDYLTWFHTLLLLLLFYGYCTGQPALAATRS